MSAQLAVVGTVVPHRSAGPPAVNGAQMAMLIADVSRLWGQTMADVAQRSGVKLSPSEIRTLSFVLRQPGMRQVEMAEWLHLGPMALSNIIDGLADHGMIERRPDPRDRRTRCIHATEAGLAIADKVNAIMEQVCGFAVARVDDIVVREVGQALLEMRFRLADYMDGARAEMTAPERRKAPRRPEPSGAR